MRLGWWAARSRLAAHTAGARRPPRSAAAADEQIERLTRRSIALSDVANQEQARVDATIRRTQSAWEKELERRIAERSGEYLAAVEHLARTRARLADEIHVASWLTRYPEQGPMPRVHDIPQPEELEDQPPRLWTHARSPPRRRDAPNQERTPTRPRRRRAAQRVRRTPQRLFRPRRRTGTRWFQGRTPGAWDAHDKIAAIHASINREKGDAA
jgi:hypothetical protein